MYSASTKTLHTRSTECYKPKIQSTQGAGTPSRATKPHIGIQKNLLEHAGTRPR
jgi:hypothetical protein